MDNNIPDFAGAHFQEAVAGPAAGNNFTYTLPQGFRYRLKSIQMQITASAAAGARFPMVRLRNNAVYYLRLPGSFLIAATEIWYCYWAAGLQVPTLIGNLWQFNPLPIDHFMNGGAQIMSDLDGIDAGDQISSIVITFDRWVEIATPPLD